MSSNLHRRERGFTLVELSIVLVIIGLLIGAVLKGQELIESARLKAHMTQMDSYRTATGIFRDRYQQWPGDFTLATTRLGAATEGGFAIANGDGDADIEGAGNTGEGQQFWAHLLQANLISGIGGANWTLGEMIPTGKLGGGMNALGVAVNGEDINWLRSGALDATGQTDNNLLSGAQAGELDTQFDDGSATGGSIQSTGAAACHTAGAYDYTTGSIACIFFMSLQ